MEMCSCVISHWPLDRRQHTVDRTHIAPSSPMSFALQASTRLSSSALTSESFEAITSSFARIRSRSAGLAGARRRGCEQVVRTDDVEALNHQRSVYQTLELLQEAQVLGDRRP